MNAVLALEISVGVDALDHDGGALDAGSVTVEPIGSFYLEAGTLCPPGDLKLPLNYFS